MNGGHAQKIKTAIKEAMHEISQDETGEAGRKSEISPEPKVNPFILKAQQKTEVVEATERILIEDEAAHNDASIPGIRISNLRKSATGEWSCRLSLNGEDFNCFRRGGWTLEVPQSYGGGLRHVLPNVAAVIQFYVNKLTRAESTQTQKNNPKQEEENVVSAHSS
jgi:hypothetical protein